MTSLLTDPAEIAKAKALCEKATKEPWERIAKFGLIHPAWAGYPEIAQEAERNKHPTAFAVLCWPTEEPTADSPEVEFRGGIDDEDFIAAARTLLPRALATIEAQATELNKRKGDPVTRLHNLAENMEGVTDAYTKEEFHALDAEIAKLRAKLKAQAPKWRDIESAPKDGTILLLFLSESAVMTIVIGHWSATDGDPQSDDWYQNDGTSGSFAIDVPVTHWMPLPAPPSPRRSGGQP
jgi:Protein of unknown function (DUF551)